MRRLLHQDLMRGRKAQRAAIILLMGLLLVLAAAFFHGGVLLRAWRRVRAGAECSAERSEPAPGLFESPPHIKRAFVLSAVDALAEDEGVIHFEFEGGAD